MYLHKDLYIYYIFSIFSSDPSLSMHHPGSNAPCITLAGARGWCAGGGLLWLHKAWGHVAARDQCPGRISGEGPLQKPFSCLGFPKDKCILVGLPSTCKPNSRELLICWQRTTLDLIWQNIMINLSSWFTIQILSCKSSLSLPFKVHWISLTKDQLPWSCPPCCSAALLGAVWGPIGARSRTSWSTIVGSKSGTLLSTWTWVRFTRTVSSPGRIFAGCVWQIAPCRTRALRTEHFVARTWILHRLRSTSNWIAIKSHFWVCEPHPCPSWQQKFRISMRQLLTKKLHEIMGLWGLHPWFWIKKLYEIMGCWGLHP